MTLIGPRLLDTFRPSIHIYSKGLVVCNHTLQNIHILPKRNLINTIKAKGAMTTICLGLRDLQRGTIASRLIGPLSAHRNPAIPQATE